MFEKNRSVYPWVTNTLIFIHLAVFIWMQRETLPNLSTDWLAFGAVEPVHVWSGEIWRLITAQFVHAGFLHFLLNTIVMYQVGKLVEMFLGPIATATIFLSCGIAGFCCSLLLHPGGIIVGASGSIFGLLGTLMGLFMFMPKRVPYRALLRPLSVLILLNFLLGEVFNRWTTSSFFIDNVTHAGGFLLGLLWALALAPQRCVRPFVSAPALVLTIATLFGLSTAALRPDFQPKYFLLMGQQALVEGRLSSAQQHARRLLIMQPNSWQAHVLSARITAAQSRQNETKNQLQKALQYHPSHNPIALWNDAFTSLKGNGSSTHTLFADETGNAMLCQFALQKPSVRMQRVLDRCAWLLLMTTDPQIHNPQQAFVWSKQAVDNAGESASLILLQTLAEAYRQTGNLQEAKSVLQWALLRAQPTQEDLAQHLLQQERLITRQLQQAKPQKTGPSAPLKSPRSSN
ncbi:MAG: rhomboid family intramembrane serine protease [Myxococcota bacterium]